MASQHGDANLNKYSSLMDLNLGSYGDHSAEAKLKQQLYDTPLFSHEFQQNAAQKPPRGQGIQFSQYALLGRQLLTPGLDPPTGTDWPLLLNTNTPWSAFICGLQGSGKSHTLACMLENCLMKGDRHGELSAPMSGFLFHYDVHSSGKPCEAAYLASHIPVNVLVSPGNLWDMTKIYQQIPNFGQNLQLYPLLLKDNHLNASRMKHLMAVNDKEGKQPLYMERIILTLRTLAIEHQTTSALKYKAFKTLLGQDDSLTEQQRRPMNQRLGLLESCLETHTVKALRKRKAPYNMFQPEAGSLTIVDLSDPLVDDSFACVMFDICLSLFLQDGSRRGKIAALDEAHKFMGDSVGSNVLTNSLLRVIREQRHLGTRVVIATQEPTVAPELLGLCNMTIVHRFSSPAWFEVLQQQLAAASAMGQKDAEDVKRIFEEINELSVGQALLFCDTAMVKKCKDSNGEHKIGTLGRNFLKIQTRPRTTQDGGQSVLASE